MCACVCTCVCTPGCTMCIHLGAKCVWRKNTQNRKTWSNRNGQGLLPELVRKHRTEGTASKATWTQRDRHKHTDTNRNVLWNTHTQTGLEKHTQIFFYKKVLVRCRHERRQRRGSGKQSWLHSWVLETQGVVQGHRERDTRTVRRQEWGMGFLGASTETARQGRVSILELVSLTSFSGL